MDIERVQSIFNAMNLHFRSQNYDFFKYNGKVRKVKHPSPQIKFLFSKKIVDEKQIILYILANQIRYYLEKSKFCGYFPEIINEKGIKIYEKFLNELKVSDALLYSDLESLHGREEFKKLKNINEVLRMLFNNKIHLFTLIQFYKFTSIKKYWCHDDPLSSEYIMFLDRISGFFKFKKNKFSETVTKFQKQL